MYSWACSCGDGTASVAPSWEAAQLQADMHACRAGRLREEHVTVVRPSSAAA